MKTHGQAYQDTRLPWGLKNSMMLFQRYTMLIRMMMLKDGYKNILVYVDDFLVIDKSKKQCNKIWGILNDLCATLGLDISQKTSKLVPPTQHIKFLGIWLNSNENGKGICTMKMDPDKLKKLQLSIKDVLYRDATQPGKITKHELDVMLGRMAHLQQTAYAAKGFYRNILNLRHSPKFDGKLDKGFKYDAKFWLNKI